MSLSDNTKLIAALQGKHAGGHLAKYTKFQLSNGEYVICAIITGDPRWPDGTRIYTSVIEHIHVDDGIVETRNTYYSLGEEVSDFSEREDLLSVL